MPDFDPNEYLKNQSQSKGFDPNKYLEENPIEKKNPIQNVSPIGTQTSKRGFEPFQSQVDTKTPSVLLSDEQKLQREQDRIAKRYETTPLNIPTEFGKVAPAMRAAKQIKETLPETPKLSRYGEIPRMQPTAMTEGQLLGESLTKRTDFQELTTDKFTEKKTGLQKQIENAQDAFRTVQGDELANQAQNYIPEEETLKIKEELGFTESVSRTGRNFVNRLQQFIPNTALALGGTLQTILGEDIGSDFYAQMTKGGDIDAQRREAFARLDELKPAMEYTKGFIESGKDFDVAGLAAAVVDATSSLLSTVITSAPTAGIGLYSDMVGGGVYDYNTTKANRLGMTVEKLYETGKNEFIVPAMLQGFAAKLEGIGLKGIKQGILANVKKGSGQRFALVAHNANKEGFTEFLQTGVDAAQSALAEGKNALQAGEIAVSTMFSKKGAESYLMGIVASGAAIGGGRILKGIFSPKSKSKASQAIQAIEQQQQELANPNLSEESRTFIWENIQNNITELVDAVDSDVNETEGLSTEQKQEINNLNTKIQAFEVVVNDPAASEETKNRAKEVLKETQAKIDDIINSKPPKIEKPTFDTEEQLIEEGKTAEEEYKKTGDQVTYEQKIKELEEREKNLVPVTENAEIGEPSQDQKLKDIQEGNTVTFTYANESEVPDVLKDKISSVSETNGVKQIRVTLSKSEADYLLKPQEDAVQVETPQPTQEAPKVEGSGVEADVDGTKELNYIKQYLPDLFKNISNKGQLEDVITFVKENIGKDKKLTNAKELEEAAVMWLNKIKYPENFKAKESPTQEAGVTPKPKQDAIQKQAAGQVPVLTEATVGEEVEQGKPQPKAKVVTEEGAKAEEVDRGKTKVYHGADIDFTIEGKRNRIMFTSKNKDYAQYYAKQRSGKLFEFDVEKSKIAKEEYVKNKIKSLGLKTEEGNLVETDDNLHRLIDPRFDDTVISKEGLDKLFSELEKEGYYGVDFMDENQELGGMNEIESIAIFNPKELVKATEKSTQEQTLAQQVEQLRAEEQAEYAAMDDPKDKAKRQEIYDRYDKLITPLLPKKEAKVQEVEPVFTNQEDYDSYRIDKTEDLDELAFIHQTNPTEPDYKVEGVRDYIGSKGKINARDYARYGDANNLTPEIKRRFIDSTNKSGSLDTQAMELSELLGVDITEEDFVNFVTEYYSMKGYEAKTKNKIQTKAEQRYYELTGKKLTPKRAESGYLKIKNKPKTNEELYQSNENLQEIGVTYEDIERYEDYAKQGSERVKEDLRDSESVGKTGTGNGGKNQEVQDTKPNLKEALDKLKVAAEKVRALKIDGKGKAFDATLGLPVAIWNGAIETVATAIEAGVATVDAIKRGLNYIQKNHRGAWNKKEYNDRVVTELGLRGIEVNGEDLIVQPLEDKATVDLVNGFYSPLEKGIAEAKTDKATGKGWMKVLSGVTEADELNYTGVKDFLESNADRPISRKELLDFMKNNRIEVVEVVLGENARNYRLKSEPPKDLGIDRFEALDILNKASDLNNPRLPEFMENRYGKSGEDILNWLKENAEDIGSYSKDTKFSQYQLEGEKENYKELLVTLPSTRKKIEPLTVLPEEYEFITDGKRIGVILKKQTFAKTLNGWFDTEKEALDSALSLINFERQSKLDKEAKDFQSSHFDEPNILVHLRMNTRTDVDGNKVLFLEEVQSDWGQKGKREGFTEATSQADIDAVGNYNKVTNKIKAVEAKIVGAILGGKEPEISKELNDLKKEREALKPLLPKNAVIEEGFANIQVKKSIPSAPFVTDTNAWIKLGLKTALKEAVKQGANKLAWTTGEQQNDRYDLSKQVDAIDVSKDDTGMYKILAKKNGETTATKFAETPQEIEAFIGKDMADKIVSANIPNGGAKVFSGVDLKVGGKGMKGFYGSPKEGSLGIVGNVAKRLFGQEPKTINLETAKNNEYYIGDSPKYADGTGVEVFNNTNDVVAEFDTEAEANKFIANKSNQVQYSIDITPELKEAVKEGIPLFKNDLVQAKERLKEAKANLDKFNNRLGIASDPKENAKVLFEYHKALVDVAKIYIKEGIEAFAKAVGETVQNVQDAWNEANGGKKKVESDFEEKVKEKEVSGIKKALVSDEIIESVNLDKISDKEMNELGKKLVETGEIKPSNIVLSIAKGTPRALQPKEVVALIYYKTTLDNKRRELLSEYNKNVANGESVADVAIELDEVQTNIELYDVMAVITANQQSLAFRLRKSLRDKDYNLVTQIEQYKKVNGGIIPADVEAKFRELDKQLTELKDKLKDAEQRAIEAEEVKSVKNIVEDIERTNSTTKKGSLTPQEKVRKKELAKKYNVFNDVTRIVTILAEKDFREYARLIFKESKGDFIEFGRELIKNVGSGIKDFLPNLYKELGGKGDANISELTQQPFVKDGELVIPPAFIRDAVEQGNTDINTLAEAVKKIVEGELPNITIRAVRDAITKYGRTVNQTKDVVQQQINEAKRLGRLYSELEDLQNKKAKEKSGKVFNKISDKERELKRKIKILERAIPPTPEVLEQTELQRSNARKEYLKRFIQEKKDRLSKGNFAPKPKVTPVRKDSEIIALETEANKIRDEYDAAHYDNEQANRSTFNKIKDTAVEWGTGISRALVAGLDFGFFLVQGIISIGSTNPLKTLYAINQSLLAGLGTNANPITETRRYFRELGSEKVEREQLANLKAQPYYPIMKASGLSIQEPNAKLGERDDALQASVINKIWNFAMLPIKYINPKAYEVAVKANPYRAGERAYTGASNAIRVQMFLDFAMALEKKGITFEDSPELYKIAANTANNMTFRGRLRFAEPIAAQLNMLYFSSRKVTASLSLVNPAYWVDLGVRNPIVAKQALLKMATFIGVATSVTLALQAFSDDDDEEQNPDMFNPYSSDFMTYRIGNTRLNFFGGLGGNVVLFARFLTGNYKTTSSSKMKKLGQDSFTPNRKELLETTLFANKLNPMAGTGYAFLNQSIGREIDWEDEAISSVSPLWAQNISELQREHPYVMASFLSYMSFLGQSINTYGTPEFIDREKDKELFNFIQSKNVSFSEKTRSNVDVLDINTGELREVTKDEFEIFKKEYADYIKNHIKDNLKELSRMPVSKVETEMTKLKTNATKYAKEIISGVAKEVITIEKDDVIYKLTPAQIKERKALNKEYIDEFGEDIIEAQTEIAIEEGKSPQEAKIIAEKKLKSLANANSKIELLDKYTDDNDNITLKIKE